MAVRRMHRKQLVARGNLLPLFSEKRGAGHEDVRHVCGAGNQHAQRQCLTASETQSSLLVCSRRARERTSSFLGAVKVLS